MRGSGQRANCINLYACFFCCAPSHYDQYSYRAFDGGANRDANAFFGHDYELFYDASAKKFAGSAAPWSQQPVRLPQCA